MNGLRGKLPPAIVRGWRTLSGMGEADLVPQARLSGPMPWVIAIMIALTVIAAAAGFALRNIASRTSAELAGGITVQVVEADAAARARQANAALERLRAMPDISSARLVPQAEIDALVEPWLGGDGSAEQGIPVPALIDARLSGSPSTERLARIAADLRASAPAARVDAQASWLRPVFGAIESLQWLALALIVLLSGATAAAVLLAARSALGANRDTVEVVHLLGGTDAQIARVFQRSMALDAAGGGAVGLALGVVVVLFVGRRFGELGAGLVGGGAFGWSDWVLLALIPLAGVALAMLTARLAVLHALRRML